MDDNSTGEPPPVTATMSRCRRAIAPALLALAIATGPAGAVERIQVMALFKDRAVVSIDGRQRTLVAGTPSPEGVLLVEADAHRAVVEVDGERRTLNLGSRISTRYAPPADAENVVHVAPDGRGMYFVAGSINGFQVRFLVDTGATLVAISSELARRLGIQYMLEGRRGVTTTASGVTESYAVTLDRVRVGEIELRRVPATVIEGPYPAEPLLGMSFLGQVQMSREGPLLELRRRR